MKKLEERFNTLGEFEGVACFDAEHALEQFHSRFPKLNINIFYEVLSDGIEKIKRVFKLKYNYYMIVSFKTNMKIQVEIRKDRYTSATIGVIATVLHRAEHSINTHNDQEVYVEQIINEFGNKPSEYTMQDDLGIDITNYNIITVEVD